MSSRTTGGASADLKTLRRARDLRRLLLIGLVGLLVLGMSDLLGVKEGEVSASGGGYELRLRYAKVSRAGLATPWQLEISRPGGFKGPVKVATTASYFAIFDQNGILPQPSASTTDGERVIWTFDEPPGSVLTIDFDARMQPSARSGEPGETAVLAGDRAVAAVRYRTRVVP